jgi:hypothetical protein
MSTWRWRFDDNDTGGIDKASAFTWRPSRQGGGITLPLYTWPKANARGLPPLATVRI